VGLSQYGARGRALDGQDAATILAHYYPGTTVGPLAGDPQIRVLILNDFASTASAPLVLYGRGGSWTVDGVAKTFPADARATVVRTVTTTPSGTKTTWQLKVTTAAGGTLYDAPAATDLRFRPGSSSTTIQLWSKPSVYDLYRGTLRVLLSSTADVIDEVSLEDYLRGVVPAEVPSSWPAAALAAQAIAARSYAAYRLRPGVSTFDMYDDTRSQVYQGVRKETAATDTAVSSTAHTVLRSGTSVANALFSSTAGGATENNENVFVSPTGARVAGVVSYLRGSPDRRPDGTSYDDSSPYATWQTRAYTPAQLSAIFASDTRTSVGSLTALDLRNRGVSGRLISVTLIGSAGSKTVSGDVFIGVFNAARSSGDPMLRSTLLGLSPIP
jgi:stage II sporulation protein D